MTQSQIADCSGSGANQDIDRYRSTPYSDMYECRYCHALFGPELLVAGCLPAHIPMGYDYSHDIEVVFTKAVDEDLAEFNAKVMTAATTAIADACADLKAKGIPRVGLDENNELVYEE